MYQLNKVKDIEGIIIHNARRKNIPIYIMAILVGVLVAKIITVHIVGIGTVNTVSMTPTVLEGSKVVINKLVTNYERGDIVVFNSPDASNKLYTKRIIGVGGDTISIEEGVVYVNQKPLKEGYILYSDSYNMAEIEVPKGCYFVLGDNRRNSTDSRHWEKQSIDSKEIVGKVVYIIDKKG